MLINRFSDLEAFIAVVERGGLTAAARHLRRSVQSVSRSLASIEQSLGTELVRRTTRISTPTAAGHQFYTRLVGAMGEIEVAASEAAGARDRPFGNLRISASSRFGPAFVVPAAASFLTAFPDVDVELCLQDDYVDLFPNGYDVAIRIGTLADSSLKARRLAELRRVTFAAPSYLSSRGRPTHPSDLAAHSCIVRTAAQDGGAWPYVVDGMLTAFTVSGRFQTDNADAAKEAAVNGIGIANGSYWQVRDLVESGALSLLLVEFEPPRTSVHAVWPPSPQPPAKTRLFLDHLAARLKAERL